MRQTAFFAFVVVLLASAVTAVAQVGLPWPGPGMPHTTGGGFVGVIDQETTVTHFFGVVAGSAALATSNVNAVDLNNNTTTCTAVKVLSTGQLDVSSGLYCNGATQTVTTWCSTNCVVGGTARVSGLYDQLNPGTIKATAASYAVSPDFILSGFNSKPTWGCVSSRSTLLTATISTTATPWSVGATFERNGSFTSFAAYATDGGGSYQIGGTSTANQMQGQGFSTGPTITATVTDGTGTSDFSHGHAALFTVPTGTGNAAMYVDGVSQTPVSGTALSAAGAFAVCGYTGNFSNAFMTRGWFDPTFVASTPGTGATNLTTVPLP